MKHHELSESLPTFAERLSRLMDERSFDAPSLAEKAGISVEIVYRILRRETERPQSKTLQVIAKVFNVSVSELIAGTNLEKPHQAAPSAFRHYSGEHALHVLSDKIGKAVVILNTGIIPDALDEFDQTPAMDRWCESSIAAIRTCSVFKDVVSRSFRSIAMKREREAVRFKESGKPPACYEYRLIPCPQAGFLNFTVLEYPRGLKEVFFGWAVSKQQGLEQPCVSTKEPRVVHIFEVWHSQLFSGGTKIPVHRHATPQEIPP